MGKLADFLKREGYYSISAAADKAKAEGVGLGKARISQLVASGDIPSEDANGSLKMVRWADIEDYANDPEKREVRRLMSVYGITVEEATALVSKKPKRKQGKK